MHIAGLAISIIGLLLGIFGGATPYTALAGLPIAIVGLVLSAIAGKKLKEQGQKSSVATAGLVIGIIAVVFTGIMFFSCGICWIIGLSAAAQV